MNKPASVLLALTLCLSWSACKHMPAVGGGWVVEDYKGDRPLLTNGLSLYDDGTCSLPMTDVDQHKTALMQGTWEAYEQADLYYLRISTTHPQFNDTYQVVAFKQVTDSVSWGKLLVMELRSDRTWMLCKRADDGPGSDRLRPPRIQE